MKHELKKENNIEYLSGHAQQGYARSLWESNDDACVKEMTEPLFKFLRKEARKYRGTHLYKIAVHNIDSYWSYTLNKYLVTITARATFTKRYRATDELKKLQTLNKKIKNQLNTFEINKKDFEDYVAGIEKYKATFIDGKY